jgi:hypothetical protein
MPNPIEWLLISDEAYDRLSGAGDVESLYRSMVQHSAAQRVVTCSSIGMD